MQQTTKADSFKYIIFAGVLKLCALYGLTVQDNVM